MRRERFADIPEDQASFTAPDTSELELVGFFPFSPKTGKQLGWTAFMERQD